MLRRRDFMKKLVFGGIAVSFGNLQTLINDVDASMAISSKKRRDIDPAIFCILGDPKIEEVLGEFASEEGCKVSYGHPDSPELIYGQQCISIVDSSVVNRDLWNCYIDICNQENQNTPCLLIGNNNDLHMSRADNVRRFEIIDRKSINHLYRIMSNVKARGIRDFLDENADRLNQSEIKWIKDGVFPLEGEIWESINPVDVSFMTGVTFEENNIIFPANEKMINYESFFYPLRYHELETRLIPQKVRSHPSYRGYYLSIFGVDIHKHLRPVELATRSTLNWVHSISATY